uniref:Uncharacterized protein n=1 Tax=Meloidogyne enterolobii TaxID=390850 RepID=A0A6V7W6H5_MELEN|nr:unnamed protein product [Meloidogyne enterolobii]
MGPANPNQIITFEHTDNFADLNQETMEVFDYKLYHQNQRDEVTPLFSHVSLISQQMGEETFNDFENFTQTVNIRGDMETEIFCFVKFKNQQNNERMAYSEKHALFPQEATTVRLEQSIIHEATDGSTIKIYQYRIQVYKVSHE